MTERYMTKWCMTKRCKAIWLTKCQLNSDGTEPPSAQHRLFLIRRQNTIYSYYLYIFMAFVNLLCRFKPS